MLRQVYPESPSWNVPSEPTVHNIGQTHSAQNLSSEQKNIQDVYYEETL